MKIILACAAVLVLATGCAPSYDEQVLTCQKALKAHDFDAHPLSVGERLPQCDALKKEDYDALNQNAILDRLGWLDDEGRFDENEMHDSVDGGR
jgi:hypothetical protein